MNFYVQDELKCHLDMEVQVTYSVFTAARIKRYRDEKNKKAKPI